MRQLGHSLLEEFDLDPDYTNLNHGSFGCIPKTVRMAHAALLLQQERRPDAWFRNTYLTLMEKTRKQLAEYIGAAVENLVLVENASAAVNSVLSSYSFEPGDQVLCLSTAYPMVLETLQYLQQSRNIEVVKVPVEFPVIDTQQIVHDVEAAMKCNSRIKFAIFSHISSMPSMIEPILELISLCRQHNIISLIDGAHAPGNIPLDLSALSPDIYLGNCHKWLFTPKGAAFLYVASHLRSDTYPQPTVISSTGWRGFAERFVYTGTRDYTNMCSITYGLQFRESIGGDAAIANYCRQLLIDASELLTKLWGTSLLVPVDLLSNQMFNVILPCDDEQRVSAMQKRLDDDYNMYIPTGKVTTRDGTTIYFARLSCQVYLELSDFQRLGEAVLTLLSRENV